MLLLAAGVWGSAIETSFEGPEGAAGGCGWRPAAAVATKFAAIVDGVKAFDAPIAAACVAAAGAAVAVAAAARSDASSVCCDARGSVGAKPKSVAAAAGTAAAN